MGKNKRNSVWASLAMLMAAISIGFTGCAPADSSVASKEEVTTPAPQPAASQRLPEASIAPEPSQAPPQQAENSNQGEIGSVELEIGKAAFPRPRELPPGKFNVLDSGFYQRQAGDGIAVFENAKETVEYPVPFDEQVSKTKRLCGFATEQGFLAACRNSEKGLQLAYSHDKGETWDFSPFYAEVGLNIQNLYFISETEGFAVLGSHDEDTIKVIATPDAGETWETRCALSLPGDVQDISFASPEIGWMVYREPIKFGSMLLETTDGGRNWQRIELPLTDEFTDKLNAINIHSPQWKNQRWECPVSFNWWGDFSNAPDYPFVYDTNTMQWNWEEPEWTLPEEVNKPRFIEYVSTVPLPDEGYFMYERENGCVMNVCQISSYMKRTEKWTEEYAEEQANKNMFEEPVSVEEINEIMSYMYDISSVKPYTGDDYMVHYWCEHGATIPHRVIHNVTVDEDENILVDMDIYTSTTTEADYGPVKKVSRYQCVFRYQPVGKAQLFTLTSFEKM